MRWMNRLFFDGHHSSRGEKFAAAFLHFHPNFGRKGSRSIARMWRAIKGWRRRAPPRSRKPRSWPEVAGIAMYLIERGEYMKAIWTLMAFGGYLRPSDVMKLRRQDMVPPVGSLSSQWCLVLNSEEYGDESKTGVSDESLIWDNVETKFLGEVFAVIKEQGPPKSRIWDFDCPEMAESFEAASEALGLVPFVPYQLRHSGPSWDRLHARRSQASVMKRGRWKSLASLARYEKGGMVTKQFEKLPDKLKAHLRMCATEIEGVVRGRRSVVRFR